MRGMESVALSYRQLIGPMVPEGRPRKTPLNELERAGEAEVWLEAQGSGGLAPRLSQPFTLAILSAAFCAPVWGGQGVEVWLWARTENGSVAENVTADKKWVRMAAGSHNSIIKYK